MPEVQPVAGDQDGAVEPAYLAGPPLFWRLLAANLFVVLGGAVFGTALTQQFVLSGSFTPLTHAGMVLAALGLSATLTAIILRLAFHPLRVLRTAIEEAQATGRPKPSQRSAMLDTYGDPDILAVAQAVRGLWDRLDQQVDLLEESNHRLEEQRRELAEKTVQLERLASLALAAQEDERRRLARELHDETMQSLVALIMGLEYALQTLRQPAPQLQAMHQTVSRLRDLAARMLDELRHLALDLRPSVLDDHGLVAAVHWLAQTQEERYGLATKVELAGYFARAATETAATETKDDTSPERLPAAVETALFRIAQEALANVAKHARAGSIIVRLARHAAHASVEVEDDGVGLPDDGRDAPPGHMGLFNMRERAALLSGHCTFQHGASGRGTIVRAVLPLSLGVTGVTGATASGHEAGVHVPSQMSSRRPANAAHQAHEARGVAPRP